tara:strand:+ start:281 stop:847 length:567 start_codon:yes stop_codon:yes gene_type:complete
MIEHIPNHEEQALARLLYYAKDYSNLRSIISMLSDGVQQIEDVLYDLLVSTTIEMAEGVTLDSWGSLVGETREGRADTEYRRFILARAAARNSHGRSETLLYIMGVVTLGPLSIQHIDFPGDYKLEYVHPTPSTVDERRRTTDIIKQATSAGVGVSIVEANPLYFGFAGNPNALGFGAGRLGRRIDDD